MFKWLRKPDPKEHPEYKRLAAACAKEIAQLATPLLPCPFCGSAAAVGFSITGPGMGYDWTINFSVWCSKAMECGVYPSTDGWPELDWVVENWNTRYSPKTETGSNSVTIANAAYAVQYS